MKPIFELPVLQSLNGDTFSLMEKEPGKGTSCSGGCYAGCCSGCGIGSGSGVPLEQLSQM
jgi:hypothetical protein